MDADNIYQRLIEALEENDGLWELINKLNDGVGTYEDVSAIAEFIGDKIAVDVAPAYTEELLEAYTKAGHDIISAAGVQAQQNLNDAARIGLKPLTRKYPKSKVQRLAEELALVEPELIPEEIKNSVPSLMLEMVDDIVSYNMDFQARAGLDPIIVRTWSGSYPSHDTKRTDWCHDLAGTYEYGQQPKNVFARHKGCRCKVEYFPNRMAKGRITALSKGEIDRNGVLWNTSTDTLEQRLRRAERRK